MTTPVVTFVYADWVAMFGEFSNCTQAQGQAWFNIAGLYFENDNCNPAFFSGNMTALMYMLTAFVGWMLAPRDAAGNPAASGQPGSPLVGRIASATEGSVTVSVDWKGGGSPSEDFFTQNKYGAMFWQATAQFRNARYAARPTYVPGGRGYPFWGGLRGSGWGGR